ncbi:hypothetical protein C1645_782935 [Glomus cerebriforme]|uniref:BED-type domain-containing protein n=1 Tax=Glomus cerebriforme TaxID=658196 RepID=A0A397SQN5_9GLOM|nr:hypothetical protein C1645_782935 [Glomus cerebriforme]
MTKVKKPAWDHFDLIGENESHPHVRCKYCPKEFKRASPKRLQDHLDKKCSSAPDYAKFSDRMSEEEQKLLELLLAKALTVNISFVEHLVQRLIRDNISHSPNDQRAMISERGFLGNYNQTENNYTLMGDQSETSNFFSYCLQQNQGEIYKINVFIITMSFV